MYITLAPWRLRAYIRRYRDRRLTRGEKPMRDDMRHFLDRENRQRTYALISMNIKGVWRSVRTFGVVINRRH